MSTYKNKMEHKMEAIKEIKLDSKKYFKNNKQEALKYLDGGDPEYYFVYSNEEPDEYSSKEPDEYKKNYFKIYTKKHVLRKRIKSENIFNFIDKYFSVIFYQRTRFNMVNPIQDGVFKHTSPVLSLTQILLEQNDPSAHLFIYALGRKKKIDRMIKKTFTNFVKRLYNPHTKLGYNYALKNIEWAF